MAFIFDDGEVLHPDEDYPENDDLYEIDPEYGIDDERYWDALLKYGDELGPPCTCTMDRVCNACREEVPA